MSTGSRKPFAQHKIAVLCSFHACCFVERRPVDVQRPVVCVTGLLDELIRLWDASPGGEMHHCFSVAATHRKVGGGQAIMTATEQRKHAARMVVGHGRADDKVGLVEIHASTSFVFCACVVMRSASTGTGQEAERDIREPAEPAGEEDEGDEGAAHRPPLPAPVGAALMTKDPSRLHGLDG